MAKAVTKRVRKKVTKVPEERKKPVDVKVQQDPAFSLFYDSKRGKV